MLANEDRYAAFRGKTILFMGAHALMVHPIQKAREMGVYTIVTDYVKGAPAKAFADEAYDISTLDIDKIIALAEEKKVDGVFTGYVDVNLAPARKVCDALGLPFYATLEQIDETMNKVNFKKNCRKHGIAVADDVPAELLDGRFDEIKYPIIVKPADSYSSKGISVCHEAAEMPAALEHAYKNSTCKQIVAEEFIDGEDIYMYFTVQNGYMSLSAMADRLMSDEQYGCAPQPLGYFFPSKYIDLYFEEIDAKLREMISDLGIENGTFFLQGFVRDGHIVLFEMGFRLTGGAGYLQIAKQNDINQVEMHLRYALSGKFDGWDLKACDNPRFKNPACVAVILLKNGKIKSISGLDAVLAREEIFDIVQFKHEGDLLDARGTLNQVFARIYMTAPEKERLDDTIAFIKKNLVILDEDGQSMIL